MSCSPRGVAVPSRRGSLYNRSFRTSPVSGNVGRPPPRAVRRPSMRYLLARFAQSAGRTAMHPGTVAVLGVALLLGLGGLSQAQPQSFASARAAFSGEPKGAMERPLDLADGNHWLNV